MQKEELMASQIPADEVLQASVDRIERNVMARISPIARNRRRLRTGLLGAGFVVVFAGGLAVGGAALAPRANPGLDGSAPAGEVSSVFALDCYASPTTQPSEIQYSSSTAASPVEANPSATCASMNASSILQDAVSSKAAELQKAGQDCGLINVGTDEWNWSSDPASDGTPGLSISNGKPMSWPTSCNITVSIPVPAVPAQSSVTCAVASNWAKVYFRPTASANEFCSKLGYEVWGD